MLQLMVVCEYGHGCNNKGCGFATPHPGLTMYKAMCGHINQKVDIIEYCELSVNNPNYQFMKRKRDI